MKKALFEGLSLSELPPVWKEKLSSVGDQEYFKKLNYFLKNEYASSREIFPQLGNVFRSLNSLDLPQVKVVIVGQDPYHGPGQAIGFSFAVPNDHFPKPPSLNNIFKELQADLGIKLPEGRSDLTGWVEQGVLLLNTTLTVESSKPLSHRDQGWEQFTNEVIEHLSSREKPMVFILWGAHAQSLKKKINLEKHVVLESAHPSPLSAYRGFFGSRVFSRANERLLEWGERPIDWEKISTAGTK